MGVWPEGAIADMPPRSDRGSVDIASHCFQFLAQRKDDAVCCLYVLGQDPFG